MRELMLLLLAVCLFCLACSLWHLLWSASAPERIRAAVLLALVLSGCHTPGQREELFKTFG